MSTPGTKPCHTLACPAMHLCLYTIFGMVSIPFTFVVIGLHQRTKNSYQSAQNPLLLELVTRDNTRSELDMV
jgi:hypothetical protein